MDHLSEQEISPETEKEIIFSVLRGERNEFQKLVLAYQDTVVGMLFRQTGNHAVAHELAQDTFLRAYRSLESFRGDASFKTWLIRIALNVSSSYFKSKRFKQQAATDSIEHTANQEQLASEAMDGYDKQTLKELQQLIASLKPIHRDVIALCALELKSYEEAASILQIPVGTVRSRLNAARNIIRKQYFEE